MFYQGNQAIDGLLEVDGVGVEIDFFYFRVGSHRGGRDPEAMGSSACGASSVL